MREMVVTRRGQSAKHGAPRVRRGTVRLPFDVARRVRAGHPWVYREAIDRKVLNEEPGATLELVDSDGEFVGRGYFDGASPIAVRVVTRNPDESLDDDCIRRRVKEAVKHRRAYAGWEQNEALRVINAEADGIPGITVDKYGDFLVVQLFTPSVSRFCEALWDALWTELSPQGIYEQRRYRPLSGEAPRSAADLVKGAPAPVDFIVKEGDCSFIVDVTAPLSTGLFADLREGRQSIAAWSKDKRVLNLFSYTGAITVAAAKGGAKEVVAIDVSAKSHAWSRRNFEANGFDAEFAEHITGDAFKVLAKMKERGRRFDFVIIDPPAFGSGSRGGKPWSAQSDYSELVAASLDVLDYGGIFAAASTTHKLSEMDFDNALAKGAARAGRNLRILERRYLPADFATTPGFPEGSYLKFAIAAA